MDFARIFFADLVVIIVVSVVYLRMGDSVDGFVEDLWLRFHWTITRSRWTKRAKALVAKRAAALELCNEAISASRTVMREILQGFASATRALWCKCRTRRRGRGSVPQDAAIGPIELKATQRLALAALEADSTAVLTRSWYEELTGVSRSQAAYDLADLVSAGLLRRVGSGRATRYELASDGGGQRRWTSERIRRELEAFCSGRETWPSASDFKSAGRNDLYVALSRYGGVAHWARELGLERSSRSLAVGGAPTPLRRKLAWAGAGALATAAVAAVAAVATIVVATRGSTPVAEPSVHAQANGAIVDESLHPVRATVAAHATKTRRPAAHATHKTKTARVVRQRAATPESAGSSSTTLISYPVHTASSSSTTTSSRSRSAASLPSSGPAPLRAPTGGGPPNPLKAP